jgi:transposase
MDRVPHDAPVYLYTGILDMRVGFDLLIRKVSEESSRQVMRGGYYVFFSRTRDRVRILYWDRDGYAMWTKRLEAGSYKVERSLGGYDEVTAVDLEALLAGMDLSRIKLRKSAENGLFL